MPVKRFQEPTDFNVRVRQKGLLFLAKTPRPTSMQWSKHAYWQDILPDMRLLHNSICNYCATWIPYSTGQHSVDHFRNKDDHPNEAYEWSNYRYVSSRFNSRKRKHEIIDPFNVQQGAFHIDFTNFFIIKSAAITDPVISTLIENTINFLGFNTDQELVNERFQFFKYYKDQIITFDYLLTCAPFLAYELERQGLR